MRRASSFDRQRAGGEIDTRGFKVADEEDVFINNFLLLFAPFAVALQKKQTKARWPRFAPICSAPSSRSPSRSPRPPLASPERTWNSHSEKDEEERERSTARLLREREAGDDVSSARGRRRQQTPLRANVGNLQENAPADAVGFPSLRLFPRSLPSPPGGRSISWELEPAVSPYEGLAPPLRRARRGSRTLPSSLLP